jgi:ABC-type transporter Mla MlaB component
VFALASECTISEIAPLRAGLTSLLEHPSAVTLDIEAVQRIDTAAMQMVAAFVRERESQGRQIQWRGSASVFGSAARLLGLAPMLHLPDPP